MPLINSCCCGLSVRTGCFVFALYTLVFHLGFMLVGYFNANVEEDVFDSNLMNQVFGYLFVLLPLSAIFASILLLIGLCVDKRQMLIPWLVSISLVTLLDVSFALYAMMHEKENFELNLATIIFALSDIFFCVTNIYGLLIVGSQYQEYRQGRGQPGCSRMRTSSRGPANNILPTPLVGIDASCDSDDVWKNDHSGHSCNKPSSKDMSYYGAGHKRSVPNSGRDGGISNGATGSHVDTLTGGGSHDTTVSSYAYDGNATSQVVKMMPIREESQSGDGGNSLSKLIPRVKIYETRRMTTSSAVRPDSRSCASTNRSLSDSNLTLEMELSHFSCASYSPIPHNNGSPSQEMDQVQIEIVNLNKNEGDEENGPSVINQVIDKDASRVPVYSTSCSASSSASSSSSTVQANSIAAHNKLNDKQVARQYRSPLTTSFSPLKCMLTMAGAEVDTKRQARVISAADDDGVNGIDGRRASLEPESCTRANLHIYYNNNCELKEPSLHPPPTSLTNSPSDRTRGSYVDKDGSGYAGKRSPKTVTIVEGDDEWKRRQGLRRGSVEAPMAHPRRYLIAQQTSSANNQYENIPV